MVPDSFQAGISQVAVSNFATDSLGFTLRVHRDSKRVVSHNFDANPTTGKVAIKL